MSLQQLHTTYQKYLKNPDSPASSHRDLVNVAQTLLIEDRPSKHFDNIIMDIIIANVKSNSFDVEKALLALSYLELYATLLYRYPWKTEYWTITHHCGFYRTMLDPCLIGADKILEKFGYRTIHGESFQLNAKPDSACLLKMSVQCLLAYSEYKIVSKACESAQSTDYETALLMHLESGGSSKQLAEKLRSESNEVLSKSTESSLSSEYSRCLPESYHGNDTNSPSLVSKRAPPPYSSHTLGRSLSNSNKYENFDKYSYTVQHSPKILANSFFSCQQQEKFQIHKNKRPLCLQTDGCSDNEYLLHTSAQNCFSGASPMYEKHVSSPPYMATNNYVMDSSLATSPYKVESTYRDSAYGSSYDAPSLNIQSHSSNSRPRQPMEHSLGKTYDDYNGCSKAFERNTPSPQSPVADLTMDYQSKLNFSSNDSLSSENEWSCGKCTVKNPSSLSVCYLCETSRYAVSNMATTQQMNHKQSGERVCENCTLKNAVTARKCSACGHHFKGYHTSV
ncbi:uncharacterized protein LOC115223998 [Octopus sinensis]|uniref:Uncharacterized protein LOC115223998 n=1 Tax=Octopus sinensis TaxID=2607531 RepID=A0A6P7TM48_9MOLL|nr:uncharacterized protein LOC115223998 [Octopus sinensis]XP_029650642.1 uncharacterized protein LOC115223998 [Octopus sinensis]XP_036368613.1 uncharacterized protein LOC115223998 [Octopus sinensis]